MPNKACGRSNVIRLINGKSNDDDDGDNRHALEAELSGDYNSALEIYDKLMKRYDTRYEKEEHIASQNSARGMEQGGESEPGQEEGEDRAFADIKISL